MFGSKRIQELESQLQSLQEKLNQETSENTSLRDQLESANRRVADLENQLNDFDLEKLKAEAKSTQAEYEGLRDLYKQKKQEFDDSKEEEEKSFARDQALKRHNLENEIRDNRNANQEYVTQTVKTFSESYNYYLNQIKLLMDALGAAATRTGEALFSAENANLKERFGAQLRDTLKTGMGQLGTGTGDLIFIGAEEEEKPVEEVVVEAEEAFGDTFDAAKDAVVETVDDVKDAVEDAVDDVKDAAGEAAEGASEFVEEKVDAAEQAMADFAESAVEPAQAEDEVEEPVNFKNLYRESLEEED